MELIDRVIKRYFIPGDKVSLLLLPRRFSLKQNPHQVLQNMPN